MYNDFAGRPSWDQASILYAVASESGYWELNNKGRVEVAEDGSNQWINGASGNHSYLVEKIAPEEIAKVIDALMVGIYRPGF